MDVSWKDNLNYLKNNLVFDRDVEALFKIFKHLLKTEKDYVIDNWMDVLQKYKIKDLKQDINFELLLKDFPIILIEEIGLDKFLDLRLKLSLDNKFLIDNYLFNIFDLNAGIYTIIKNNLYNEYVINNVDIIYENKNSIPNDIFDYDIFIGNVIKLYIENNIIDIPYFKKLIKTINDKKEQIIVNTYLIDYIN